MKIMKTSMKTSMVTTAILSMIATNVDAATVVANFDSRGRQVNSASAQSPTFANTAILAVGSVSGSSDFFRTYLAFDLTNEEQATTVSLTLFAGSGSSFNESNTTTDLLQNFTLFSMASSWDGASNNPLPGGTDLATFATTLSANPAGNVTFSSNDFTAAYNAAVGGWLYLGIYSPEGEAAASGTRAFQWFRGTDGSDSVDGERPTLSYTAIPEPTTALLGGLGLLALLRRRR
jgi:hypothetical protein